MPPRVRPPGEGDAESVLRVIVARDVADLGVPDFTLDDLRADWATPGLALEHDVRVADTGGEIRGYAILLGDDAVVVVHPEAEGQGTGTVLRRWAEARASERGTAVLRQFAYGANDGARRLLHEAGYAPAQHYFRLRADLAVVPPPTEAALRAFEPRDEAAVHELIEEAFTEIEGVTPMTLDAVAREGTPARPGTTRRCGCWPRTSTASSAPRSASAGRDGTGYVAELAVAARARGRGLGRALLLGLFEAFRRGGLRHAELSVHGRNRGALALYESAGMRPTWAAERWEKALGS